MKKTIEIRTIKQFNPAKWGLSIEDALGVTISWAELNRSTVDELIEKLNAASEAGAPWPKYSKKSSDL